MGQRAESLLEPAWRAAPGGGLAWWFIVHEHRQPWWVAAASVLRLIKETVQTAHHVSSEKRAKRASLRVLCIG